MTQHHRENIDTRAVAPASHDRRRRSDLRGRAWRQRSRRCRACSRASAPARRSVPWVSIAADGTITIMSPATEMGQGSMTSLPLIIAEELDADWSKVRIVPAPPIDAIYGNPGFGGMMYTAGSNAVTSYYRPLRTFGAQVRRVLLDNAANKLGVPVEELTTEPSVVVHAKSGRKLGYGEIAAIAEVPAKAPEIKPEELKKPAQFRLIGKDVMRIELPSKVNGSARYSIDVQVPNMLYGAVLRAPVEGSVPDKIDDAKAKVIAGAVRIVRLPYGVGVLADTPWAAFEARRALAQSVTWSRTGTAWGFDSDKGMERFAADAKNLSRGATEWSQGRRRARRDAEGCLHHGGRVPLRLRLSRADGAAERHRLGVAGRRCRRNLGRNAEPDHRLRGARQAARHSARQGEAQRHADGRRLRPARQPRRRFHHRRGADVERGRAAGEGDVDARGRRPQRTLPPDLRPLPEGRIRSVRQAHGLASSRRRGSCRALHGSGALPDERRQGRHRDARRRPARLRRSAPTGRAALSRHRCAHEPSARDQLHRQQVCHRGFSGRDRAQARDRSRRLSPRAPEEHAARHQGGSSGWRRWRTGGASATVVRSASPISTIPARWWPASPRFRSTAAAGRSRCTTSGAPSIAASRCSRTTWWRRPRAASSMASAWP